MFEQIISSLVPAHFNPNSIHHLTSGTNALYLKVFLCFCHSRQKQGRGTVGCGVDEQDEPDKKKAKQETFSPYVPE